MELVILWALTWAIVRGVRDTVANTSALLHGQPVQVGGGPARAGGGSGSARMGGPVAVAGRPSYAGRSVGTVAAVVKESFTSGTRQGWVYGRERYRARQDRRAVAKEARGTRTAWVGVGEVADAPTLDTSTPGGVDRDHSRAEGSATAPEAPRPDTRQLLDEALAAVAADNATDAPTTADTPSQPDTASTPDAPGTAGTPGRSPAAPGEAPRFGTHAAAPGVVPADGQADGPVADLGGPAEPPAEPQVDPGPDPGPAGAPDSADTPAVDPEAVTGGDAAESGADVQAAESGGRAARLYAVPDPADADPDQTAGPGSTPAADTSSEPEEPASDTPQGGDDTVTTMTGETTSIDATRTYFGQLVEHVQSQILSQLELCQATLTTADMDPATIGHLTSAMEQFAAARASVEQALASLNSRHALMEEAVNTTEHAAQRDYYRHQ